MELYIVCIIVFAVTFFSAISMFIIDWSVHVSMNKKEKLPYDWCTFKTFIREFNKCKTHSDLEVGGMFKHSIFGHEHGAGCKDIVYLYGAGCKYTVYLHASIIKFNKKCMILYPHSYLKYTVWKHNFIKTHGINESKHNYRQRGLWK